MRLLLEATSGCCGSRPRSHASGTPGSSSGSAVRIAAADRRRGSTPMPPLRPACPRRLATRPQQRLQSPPARPHPRVGNPGFGRHIHSPAEATTDDAHNTYARRRGRRRRRDNARTRNRNKDRNRCGVPQFQLPQRTPGRTRQARGGRQRPPGGAWAGPGAHCGVGPAWVLGGFFGPSASRLTVG